MLIKSQPAVRLHTGAVYTSTPADLPDPPFRCFEGLVPRLGTTLGSTSNDQLTSTTSTTRFRLPFLSFGNFFLRKFGSLENGKNRTQLPFRARTPVHTAANQPNERLPEVMT